MRKLHALIASFVLVIPVVLVALSSTAHAATATHHVLRHHPLAHRVSHLSKHV